MGKHHNTAYYRHLRNVRLYLDGYECQNCGHKSFSNQAHHLSGDSSDTAGFEGWYALKVDLECLTTLCKGCHRLVTRLRK